MARKVLALLALSVSLAMVSIEAEAFLKHLFGKSGDGIQESEPASRLRARDFDSDSDDEDGTGGGRYVKTAAKGTTRKAAGFGKHRVDLSATRPSDQDTDQEDSDSLPRYPRRFSRARSRSSRPGPAHGRTLRNQLRQEHKPVSSYLEEQRAAIRDSGEESEVGEDDDATTSSHHRHQFLAHKNKDTGRKLTPVKEEKDNGLEEDDDDGDLDAWLDDDQDGLNPMVNADKRSKKSSEQKELKYVSTGPKRKSKNQVARRDLSSKIKIRTVPRKQFAVHQNGDTGEKKSGGLTSKKFWGKQWKDVKKITNKGVDAAMKTLNDLPAGFEKIKESVSTSWELNNKGKINALQQEARKAATFVRSEFAKFTIVWTNIMEQALNFLGDKDLDKVTWNENDELDFRKEALSSLVIGYEFIRLMIIWRENLLLAHEGFIIWLDELKALCEKQDLDIDTDLEFPPAEVHNYMMLMAWDRFQFESLEPRFKLDHLMDVEDSRPKDYQNKFFRNVVVLQEIYFPTIEELDNERMSVKLPNVDQYDTADFFEEFRDDIASRKIDDIDILAPNELANFVGKLTPQLRFNPLVYTKSYLSNLREQMQEAQWEREQELAEANHEQENWNGEYED